MAYTWRASKEGTVGSASIIVTEPTSAAQGDWEFVLIATGLKTTTVATPAGWSLFGDSGAGVNTRYYIFYVTGGRGGSAPGLTFTASDTSTHEWHCCGVAGSNTVIEASAIQALATTQFPNPPAASASIAGCEAIAIGFNFAGATWGHPTYNAIRSVNTGALDCVAASKDLMVAGSEDPAAFTGPGGSNDVYAATILLQPLSIAGTSGPGVDDQWRRAPALQPDTQRSAWADGDRNWVAPSVRDNRSRWQ